MTEQKRQRGQARQKMIGELLDSPPPSPPKKKALTRFIWGAMGVITLFFALIGLGELANMGVFGNNWQGGSTGAFLNGLAYLAQPFNMAINLSGVAGIAVLSISCLWLAFEFFHNSISQEAFVDSLPWRQKEVREQPEESVVARTFSALSLNQETPQDLVRLGLNPVAWLVFPLELMRLTLLSGIDRVSGHRQNKGVVVLKGFLSGLFFPLRPLKGILMLIDLLPRSVVYVIGLFQDSLIPFSPIIEREKSGQSLFSHPTPTQTIQNNDVYERIRYFWEVEPEENPGEPPLLKHSQKRRYLAYTHIHIDVLRKTREGHPMLMQKEGRQAA